MAEYIERPALQPRGFDQGVTLPYGLRVAEVKAALDDIYDFLHNINRFLTERGWDRLEETLMAATFSGMMSELFVAGVSKRSETASILRSGVDKLEANAVYRDPTYVRRARRRGTAS